LFYDFLWGNIVIGWQEREHVAVDQDSLDDPRSIQLLR